MALTTFLQRHIVNLLLLSSWIPLSALASQDTLPPHLPRVPIDALHIEAPLPTPEPTSPAAITTSGGLLPRELLARADTGGQTSSSSASNDYTCGPNKPCGNGACCGASGWCGYEPKYCGDGCQSNCDAKAECGTYAATPGKGCPLNVCCSEFGFCGTTSEFCAAGCQSNCDQPKPSVAKSNTQKKIVAYWEGWNENKACGQMEPSEIPVNDISHLIFAFGFITPSPDFKITNMDDVRPELFREVAFLKDKNPDLTVMIALGGWTFNDPGKWQPVFGDIISSSENRKKFISNLLGFLSQYGFDGVDFDWEYPGAEDRGGHKEDGVNYTQFLKELRDAIKKSGRDYVVTYTAPTSYWYLRHFDLENMHQYVDWINLMSYDLHGIWDSNNPIGSQVLAHTNLTEIDLALALFWRNNIPPGDIVLGMGFYGRSFKLKDSKCWKPGFTFSGPGDKGECTNTAGFLSYAEIMDIVASTNAKPTYDKEAKVNYLVYGQNNWISYDDKRTFQDKIDYANNMGLNGLMMWAIDLDDPKRTALSALTGNAVADELDPLAATDGSTTVGHSSSDSSQCRVTDCGGFCNQSETAVGRVKSSFGDHACSGGSSNARWVCCPAWTSLTPDDCHWNAGGGAVKTDCSEKCDIGEIKLFRDSDGWKGDLKTGEYDYHCLRGSKVFCCKAGNMQQYLDICSWSKCGDSCPSDKQHVLTTDSGGPRDGGTRCDGYTDGDVFTNPAGQSDDWKDPTKGTANHRKLCCPKEDSFKNCDWKSSKVCSEQCGQGQITLDLDPQGQGGYYCDNGRQQAFCCDPPGGTNQPFLPVSLENLFPPEYLPPADAVPQFELTGFNGRAGIGDANPGETGVAFFLMAGSDTVVSSARKRDDGRGLHFLDCPPHVLDQPNDRVQTARVVCLDSPTDECLAMALNGVEGTIVHMPPDCGNSSFARAVSLVPSQDQSVPVELVTAGRNPSSAVFDFSFDYEMPLVRRDAGTISIRMDYSNVKGYWDSLVDSPGKKKKRDDSSLQDLVDRFYSSSGLDWATKFNDLDFDDSASLSDLGKSDIAHLVFFETEMCATDEGQNGEGIAVAVDGELDVDLFYGFSLIATWDPSSTVKVHEVAGFLHASGTTSAKYTVAGIGTLDVSQKLNGASITKTSGQKSIGGHALYHGWASFVPYKEEGVRLSSRTSSGKAVSFNGHLEVSAKADWGNLNNHFPGGSINKAPDLVVSKSNKLTPLGQDIPESSISVASTVKLGLKVDLAFSKPYQFAVDGELPDMSITQTLAGVFSLQGTSSEICLNTEVTQEHKQTLTSGSYVGWPATSEVQYMTGASEVGTKECFTASSSSSSKKKKRQNNSVPGDFSGLEGIPDLTNLINSEARGGATVPEISCNGCQSCVVSTDPDKNICCECAWLPPEDNFLFGITWPSSISKRSLTGGYVHSNLEDDILAEVHGRLAKSSGPLNADDTLLSDIYDDVLATLGSKPGMSPAERPSMLEEPLSTADDEILHELLKRVAQISLTRKEIRFWDTSVTGDQGSYTVETETYPSYPDYYRNPRTDANWDGSQYTAVKKYFHNATAVCTSFDVAQAATADVMFPWPDTGYQGFTYARGTGYHQMYQTEHVFEPQTIARFFSNWMPSGSAATRRERFWTENYILTPNSQWGDGTAFVHLLADEVGTRFTQDRLTVFMSRPNGMKGSLFGGSVSVTQARFGEIAAGAKQLLVARQLGLVFPYMNTDTVWQSFCDSYNGMLDLFGQFDTWYTGQTGVNPDLSGEWPRFIRSELDMVVKRARDDLKVMNQRRKNAGLPYRTLWQTVMAVNGGEIQKVKLERTDKCRNLPASTVGLFTG